MNEQYINEIRKHEEAVLKKIAETTFDRLILSEEEYTQLMSYSFDSEDDLKLVMEALFHKEKENRLFTNHLVIEVGKIRYYYIFDDKDQRLQIGKYEKNQILFNGFLNNCVKNKVEVDINTDCIVGVHKFQELSRKIVNNLLALPINTANHNEIMTNLMLKEFHRLAQETINLLAGVAHHVLTYKEIRTITTSNPSSFTPKPNVSKQPKNNPRIIRLSKIIYQREGENNTNVQKKNRQYHVTEWEVRGHWREYKNGKKIWIRPHKKSPKNNKTTLDNKINKSKIYKLK